MSLYNEGPIGSRLRSHNKEASQVASTGSDANNSSDKPSQPSRQNQHANTKPSTEKKSVLSSSSCRTGQSSMDQSTKKSNDSVSKKSVRISSPCRTSQPSKDKIAAKNSSDSTPKRSEIHVSSSCRTNQSSKDQGVKNSKVSKPKSEINITSPCRTSQHSKDIQGAQNIEDSTSKRSVTLISSSCRTSQPSKDRATKRTKSETQRKDLMSLLAKLDSQPKSGVNVSPASKPNHHLQNQETKISNSSAPNKSGISRPSPSNVGKEQEKTIPSVKFSHHLLAETPIYHIRWTGFDISRTQPAGWNCELCEKDLSYSPEEEEDELEHSLHSEDDDLDDSYYSEEELEYFMPPEVTVLPCNHVFHSMCLQLAAVGEKLTDPSCPICLS